MTGDAAERYASGVRPDDTIESGGWGVLAAFPLLPLAAAPPILAAWARLSTPLLVLSFLAGALIAWWVVLLGMRLDFRQGQRKRWRVVRAYADGLPWVALDEAVAGDYVRVEGCARLRGQERGESVTREAVFPRTFAPDAQHPVHVETLTSGFEIEDASGSAIAVPPTVILLIDGVWDGWDAVVPAGSSVELTGRLERVNDVDSDRSTGYRDRAGRKRFELRGTDEAPVVIRMIARPTPANDRVKARIELASVGSGEVGVETQREAGNGHESRDAHRAPRGDT